MHFAGLNCNFKLKSLIFLKLYWFAVRSNLFLKSLLDLECAARLY